jgi:hypothetical protein
MLGSAAYDPAADAKKADDTTIGSPLKKQRASVSGIDTEAMRSSAAAVARGLGFGFVGDVNSEKVSSGPTTFGGELGKPAEKNGPGASPLAASPLSADAAKETKNESQEPVDEEL